ncbi:MAG: hypothetical protein ACE5HV_18170, partial [Acidobacteriota bacterium]
PMLESHATLGYLAGVTSFVRTLGFNPDAYRRLLHLFHTPAVNLAVLTRLWVRLVEQLFCPLRVGDYRNRSANPVPGFGAAGSRGPTPRRRVS